MKPATKLAKGVRFTVDEYSSMPPVEIVGQTRKYWRVAEIREESSLWRRAWYRVPKANLVGKTVRILPAGAPLPPVAPTPSAPTAVAPTPVGRVKREKAPRKRPPKYIEGAPGVVIPDVVQQAGAGAAMWFGEFFREKVQNPNTRAAYARATGQFFEWCAGRGLTLQSIEPSHVAAYVLELGTRPAGERRAGREGPLSAQSVRQHLAAIRAVFEWWVSKAIMMHNPAGSVHAPDPEPVAAPVRAALSAADVRSLIDAIPLTRLMHRDNRLVEVPDLVALRDRALIAVMVYACARIGAALAMEVSDFYKEGGGSRLRLHEKGGALHEVPAHRTLEAYLKAYLRAARIGADRRSPLFRAAIARSNRLSDGPMGRTDALRMVKRRARAAGLPDSTCCHSFRVAGIGAFLEAGGSIEMAQAIAAHESPRTTRRYARAAGRLTRDDLERIRI